MKKIICYLIVVPILLNIGSSLCAKEKSFSDETGYCLNGKSDFPEWERFLSNKQLFRQSSYSSSTAGGGGEYSATEIKIYGNHTFSFWYEHEMYGITSFSKKDNGQGYWKIITGSNGEPVIQANLTDGRVWYFTVRASGKDLYLNDEKYAYADLN